MDVLSSLSPNLAEIAADEIGGIGLIKPNRAPEIKAA